MRGYNVMRGYFEDPRRPRKAIDADGWLHTGDIGVLDERGNLRITDRMKDMYIVGGFNAYPAEIEQAAVPTIRRSREVAVVGVPDERLGEVGKAFVVPRPGAQRRRRRAHRPGARERMANYKVPRVGRDGRRSCRVNASGKVLKFELRKGDAG